MFYFKKRKCLLILLLEIQRMRLSCQLSKTKLLPKLIAINNPLLKNPYVLLKDIQV